MCVCGATDDVALCYVPIAFSFSTLFFFPATLRSIHQYTNGMTVDSCRLFTFAAHTPLFANFFFCFVLHHLSGKKSHLFYFECCIARFFHRSSSSVLFPLTCLGVGSFYHEGHREVGVTRPFFFLSPRRRRPKKKTQWGFSPQHASSCVVFLRAFSLPFSTHYMHYGGKEAN